MSKQDTKRAMSSSRWSIVVDDESRVKKRFSISAGIMRGSAVPKCSWPSFNNTAVKVHTTLFAQAPDHASPHCAAMIVKSVEEPYLCENPVQWAMNNDQFSMKQVEGDP